MSSYISKGSAQNKAIVIIANQTQKWNQSNIENIVRLFMKWFALTLLISLLYSLSTAADKNTNTDCASQEKNLETPTKRELSKHILIWAWQHFNEAQSQEK